MSELPARSKDLNVAGKIVYWMGLGIITIVLWSLFSLIAIYLPSLMVGKLIFPNDANSFALMVTRLSLIVTGPAFFIAWVTFPKSDHTFLKYIEGSFAGEIFGFICIRFFSNSDLSEISRFIALFTLFGALAFVLVTKVVNHRRFHAR